MDEKRDVIGNGEEIGQGEVSLTPGEEPATSALISQARLFSYIVITSLVTAEGTG